MATRVVDSTSRAAGYPVGLVASVGDMNRDQRPDLLAGTSELGPPGAYLVFGNGPALVRLAPLRGAVPVLPGGRTAFAARFRLSTGELRKRTGHLAPPAVRALRLDGNVRMRAIASATDGRGRRAVTSRELYLVDRP